MPSDATWVVVADGASARFLVRQRGGFPLVELEALRLAEAKARRAPAAAAPKAPGHGPLVLPEHQNEQAIREHDFLTAVAARINLAVAEHAIGKLVLIAPPRALGALRSHLGQASSDCVALAIDKDLVDESAKQIDDRLHQHRL